MELYILRHGIAEERRPALPDSQRRLTPDGSRKVRRIGKALKGLKVKFDLILSSPYYRAKETAELVAATLNKVKALKLTSALTPDGSPRDLIEELNRNHPRCKCILLVGHEPYLSSLVSLLLSGRSDLSITLKKGSLCGLTMQKLHYGRCATLESLLTPKHLRSIK
jgi:phosphohistidine phosphatase